MLPEAVLALCAYCSAVVVLHLMHLCTLWEPIVLRTFAVSFHKRTEVLLLPLFHHGVFIVLLCTPKPPWKVCTPPMVNKSAVYFLAYQLLCPIRGKPIAMVSDASLRLGCIVHVRCECVCLCVTLPR